MTLALIEAGYDSIGMIGTEGPEEYMLNSKILMSLLQKGETRVFAVDSLVNRKIQSHHLFCQQM